MLGSERVRAPQPTSGGRETDTLDAMAYARKVAAEYQAIETGYRKARCAFVVRALTSYRKLLKKL